jgi:hypothetical protein
MPTLISSSGTVHGSIPPIVLRSDPDGDKEKDPRLKQTDQSCAHCNATDSPLWRRGEKGETLCNACGLYWKHHNTYRPVNVVDVLEDKSGGRPKQQKSRSQRHQKGSPKKTSSLPVDEQLGNPKSSIETGKCKDLRKQPRLRPPLAPKPTNSTAVTNRKKENIILYAMCGNRMLFQGDHVVVRSQNHLVYFAVLTDFTMDPETGSKECRLRWLIPKPQHADTVCFNVDQVTPTMFTIGPDHECLEPIESVIDVFYSPYRTGELMAKDAGELMSDLEAAHILCSFD